MKTKERKRKVLFLNLTAFSQTGGLEKFNRCFLKALNETEASANTSSNSFSLYDTSANSNYYPAEKYKGFGKRRFSFVLNSVLEGLKKDIIILGHVNLAIVGLLIKLLSPKTRLVLICHGIEVWSEMPGLQKRLLRKVDRVLAVSKYTQQKLVDVQHVEQDKTVIFHNTIDPYFKTPSTFSKDKQLLKKYGLDEQDFILFTLCRLSSSEKYKGYDEVIKVLPQLLKRHPNIKYVIAGKYDAEEKVRIDKLIEQLGVENHVMLTGYIDDNEIINHYQLGDVYIMPSKGEGFGIVFIEAMACGSRVIAGNKDGSVDALRNGELGTLVDPENTHEIVSAIDNYINSKASWDEVSAKSLQSKTFESFGFDVYKKNLSSILFAAINN